MCRITSSEHRSGFRRLLQTLLLSHSHISDGEDGREFAISIGALPEYTDANQAAHIAGCLTGPEVFTQ